MKISVVAMGEMGSGIAGRLVERGADVLTSLEGRSNASRERATAAGVVATDDQGVVEQSAMILSIVPPDRAIATAERFAPLIAASKSRPVYIDCNAIAPKTLSQISSLFSKNGLPLLDASIIGAAPKSDGSSPRLYMSGPIGQEANILRELGLDARPLSNRLGDASALKMAYAGITKGFQALGSAMALGAGRNGAMPDLVLELKDSQPLLYQWLSKQIPVMYNKAYRWDGEMREIAAFLQPEAGASGMLKGAADLYQHIAEDNRSGPDSEIISLLDRFVGRARN